MRLVFVIIFATATLAEVWSVAAAASDGSSSVGGGGDQVVYLIHFALFFGSFMIFVMRKKRLLSIFVPPFTHARLCCNQDSFGKTEHFIPKGFSAFKSAAEQIKAFPQKNILFQRNLKTEGKKINMKNFFFSTY